MTNASLPSTLDAIRRKVEAGRRLDAAEGEFLFHNDVDLHVVGQLANLVRERKNDRLAYYNINAHINPTNVCVYRCPRRRRPGRLRDGRRRNSCPGR